MNNDITRKEFSDCLNCLQESGIILIELPTQEYCKSSICSVVEMVNHGFKGVYVSFQRPFENIKNLLENESIDTSSLLFIDVASVLGEEEYSTSGQCIHISDEISIDELVHAIHESLQKIDHDKKFIYLDSITTITLYKPLSETMRFSEFLMHLVKNHSGPSTLLVMNVAKDLNQKKFVKDVALKVDKVLSA